MNNELIGKLVDVEINQNGRCQVSHNGDTMSASNPTPTIMAGRFVFSGIWQPISLYDSI